MKITSCRSCGSPMVFLPTAAGKLEPCNARTGEQRKALLDATLFDPKVHESHFATCPHAANFRRKPK